MKNKKQFDSQILKLKQFSEEPTIDIGKCVYALPRYSIVSVTFVAMGARNQVGTGLSSGPPAYVAWLLNSRLGSWNRFLAPLRDLSFRLCTEPE